MVTSFRLHPHLDKQDLTDAFRRNGRVCVSPFLDDRCAEALRRHLVSREDWRLVLNAGERVYEIDGAGMAALTPGQVEELNNRVDAAARGGFQYRFGSIRVAEPPDQNTLLDNFARFLCSEPVTDLLRVIVADAGIDFADAQATRFRPGDFLTSHDDDVAGKRRIAAYVMSLNPGWRPEWGGLLAFHGDADIVAYPPKANALSLFTVPQQHSVTQVASYAGDNRYSVTGWLRHHPRDG